MCRGQSIMDAAKFFRFPFAVLLHLRDKGSDLALQQFGEGAHNVLSGCV
jgi:hypothetical protein